MRSLRAIWCDSYFSCFNKCSINLHCYKIGFQFVHDNCIVSASVHAVILVTVDCINTESVARHPQRRCCVHAAVRHYRSKLERGRAGMPTRRACVWRTRPTPTPGLMQYWTIAVKCPNCAMCRRLRPARVYLSSPDSADDAKIISHASRRVPVMSHVFIVSAESRDVGR